MFHTAPRGILVNTCRYACRVCSPLQSRPFSVLPAQNPYLSFDWVPITSLTSSPAAFPPCHCAAILLVSSLFLSHPRLAVPQSLCIFYFLCLECSSTYQWLAPSLHPGLWSNVTLLWRSSLTPTLSLPHHSFLLDTMSDLMKSSKNNTKNFFPELLESKWPI